VEPTIYGRALLKRSITVFDELKQSVRDIEFLSDPTCGELRFGCSESVATILSPVVDRFCATYPRVLAQLSIVPPPRERQMTQLRERKLDLTVSRVTPALPADAEIEDDLKVEQLFNDRLVVATGNQSPFASRRKVALAELVHASWIQAGGDSWGDLSMANLFRSNGLPMPKISVVTYAVPLRIDLLNTGKYVAAIAKSIADRYALKVLPVEVPVRPWMVSIITLKNRTLSPVAEHFVEHLCDFGRTMRESEPTRGIRGRRSPPRLRS
jgi:DNA-binding transcriptional LysR family regulator